MAQVAALPPPLANYIPGKIIGQMMSNLLKICNILDAVVEREKKEEANNWGYFGKMILFGHQVWAVKAQRSCQSPNLAKIQEMKSISKPPLPIELYTICQNMSPEEYRK